MERQRYYTAAEGMTYRRKVDNVIVGRTLYLGKFIDGSVDVIENYEEVIDEELKKRRAEIEEKNASIKKEMESRKSQKEG